LLDDLRERLGWSPDVTIYLDANPETCMERLKKRGRRAEKEVALSYLKRIDALHRQLFGRDHRIGSDLLQRDAAAAVIDHARATRDRLVTAARQSATRDRGSKPAVTPSRNVVDVRMLSVAKGRHAAPLAVCFYDEDEENGFLSNYYLSLIGADNLSGTLLADALETALGNEHAAPFASSEHMYAGIKCLLFGDNDALRAVTASPHISCDEAKSAGREVKNFHNETWAAVRYAVMAITLRCKFEENLMLARRLLATSDANLYECSVSDLTWGTGVSVEDMRRNPGGAFKGNNLLGKALADTRTALRSTSDALTAFRNECLNQGYDDKRVASALQDMRKQCLVSDLNKCIDESPLLRQRLLTLVSGEGTDLAALPAAAALSSARHQPAVQICTRCPEQHALSSNADPNIMCFSPCCLKAGPLSGHIPINAAAARAHAPQAANFCDVGCYARFVDEVVTNSQRSSRSSIERTVDSITCKRVGCDLLRHPRDPLFSSSNDSVKRGAFARWSSGVRPNDLHDFCGRRCARAVKRGGQAKPVAIMTSAAASLDLQASELAVSDILSDNPELASSWNPRNSELAPNRRDSSQFLVRARFKIMRGDVCCWQSHIVLVDTGSALTIVSPELMYFTANTPRTSQIVVSGVHANTASMDSAHHPSGPGFVQIFGGPHLDDGDGSAWVQLRAVAGHPRHLRNSYGSYAAMISFPDFVRIGWSFDNHREALLCPVPVGGRSSLPEMGFDFDHTTTDPLSARVHYPPYYPSPSFCPSTVDPTQPRRAAERGQGE